MKLEEAEARLRQKVQDGLELQHVEERQGENMAFLNYSVDDKNQLTIWHTEVPNEMQHRGVGGRLVQQVIQIAETFGYTVIPICPFAKDYLARHPQP